MNACESRISSSMEIRLFNAEDANSVLQIRKKNLELSDKKDYPEHITQTMIKTLSNEKLIEVSKKSNRIILVAVIDSKVVGSGCLVDDNVRLMFVDPDFHHKGIGSELLRRIEKLAIEKGISKLYLKSSLPAEEFYARFEFVKYGEETKEMGPVILMSKQFST
jgi:putative acetyltransferase